MGEFLSYHNTRNKLTELNECKRVVMWSGGVDSTFLLDSILEKYGKEEKVGAFSLYGDFIDADKLRGENEARGRYIKSIEGFNNIDLTFVCIELKLDHPMFISETCGIQLANWITNVYPLVGKDAIIYAGVLYSDPQVIHIDAAKQLVETLNKIYNKNVTIEFPLTLFDKDMVIHHCHNRGILDHTWVCEKPEKDKDNIYQCSGVNCVSCREHLIPLISLYKRGSMTKDEINNHLSSTKFTRTIETIIMSKDTFKTRFKGYEDIQPKYFI